MAITSVLMYEGDNKTFVWRHPIQDFNMGSELLVHESQEAIFMVDGKVLDTFGPGKHILETENLPVARTILKFATGGKNAFHAELYFVNLTEQMAIRWGTDSKVSYLDPVYDFPLEIGACGEMSLSVSNSNKLLIKVVGTEQNLSQNQLTVFFRAFLMNRAKSILAQEIKEKKISIFEIDMHLPELSEAIRTKLLDDFFDYGINLNSFLITTVLKPDEDRNYQKFKDIFFRQKSDVMEAQLQQKLTIIEQETKAKSTVIEAEATAKKRELEGYTYQQEKGFEVAKEAAKNEAVGQFSNVGIGLGMVTGVGAEIGKTVGGVAGQAMQSVTVPAAPHTEKRFCMNCGQELSSTAMFCENCGTKAVTSNSCTNCGYVLTNDANFCPKCGTRREK
ncbi:SPFH domain-containing protein [Oribacterium sp. FC2011]|uniref:SPFH domain-containing protein n=1 Tax=Oribacterium sp. FC2011 TaxID=1408311 RepID=UPI0004E22E4F|nr:SPFH domain-containing protein [Oribacterium sp. FC2011]